VPTADVSVITAAYNSAGDIERNVRSVAAQSLQPMEHIIVDDGSTDGTAAVVDDLRRAFPHLRLVRQEHRGAGRARNAGIATAAARYIAFLDSDDYWSERKLEAQIGFMAANDVPFSYGDYDAVDAVSGASLGQHWAPERVAYHDLLRGCPIGCLTVAFDQAALGKRYMPDVRRGQDWGLWLALTREGAIGRRYPGCHAAYRQSTGSLSSRKLEKAADIYRIYREQERLGPVQSARYMAVHVLSALTKRPASSARGEDSLEQG
jgi:teichuronic acid biosynthesis glycosyltransferase TuaG